LRAAQRSFLVVATKTDRLSGNQLQNSITALRREFELEKVLPYSAKTGIGKELLWKAIKKLTSGSTEEYPNDSMTQ